MAAPDLPDLVNLAVPFFIATILLELVWGHFRGTARYETRDTLASLVMGGGNLVEGMVIGLVAVWTYDAVYVVAPLPFGEQAWGWHPLIFIACFVADDLRYYWFHRWSHEIRWFWASHVNHHSSQHYNLSTALRQTWTSNLTGAFLMRVPLVLVGFDPLMVFFSGSINLVYQYWIHTELIGRMPRWFEAVMNTPSHHRVHHATNPRYLDANYAGTFIIWDKLFGTFVPEQPLADRPRYGIVGNLLTFNPLRICFHEWQSMIRDATRRGLTPRQRLGYLFGPPGWSHDNSRRTSAELKAAYVARHPEQAGEPGLS